MTTNEINPYLYPFNNDKCNYPKGSQVFKNSFRSERCTNEALIEYDTESILQDIINGKTKGNTLDVPMLSKDELLNILGVITKNIVQIAHSKSEF